MKTPKTMEEYLARLPPDQRTALESLRATIRAAAPGAEEGISSRVPAFKYQGNYLVSFGAAKHHVSLYVMRGAALSRVKARLEAFETTRTVVRFTPLKPLPAALVRTIVKARMKEIASG